MNAHQLSVILFAAGLLVGGGCRSVKPVVASPLEMSPLEGAWELVRVVLADGNIDPSVAKAEVVFDHDGSYRSTMITDDGSRLETKGSFLVSGNQVLVVTESGANQFSFQFDGNLLVITGLGQRDRGWMVRTDQVKVGNSDF
jgi:hypothetical protein